jgi:hypothetical protein
MFPALCFMKDLTGRRTCYLPRGLLPLSFRHELYERTSWHKQTGGSWGRREPDKTGADDLRGHCVEVGYI